jgi:hypothetical protein
MTPEESDWKQYDMMATTVRSSRDLVLKANIFYYAVTGAILSFYCGALFGSAALLFLIACGLASLMVFGARLGLPG